MMDGLARGAGPGQHGQCNDREATMRTTMPDAAMRGNIKKPIGRPVSAPTRIALVALTALLALPAISADQPVAAKARLRTVTRTFPAFSGADLLNTPNTSPVSASVGYPTQIVVDGLKGGIRDVNVRITGLAHATPDDVEMLLVGPEGQTAIIMADVGGTTAAADLSLRLDDEAATPLPDNTPLQSGTFRPTNAENTAIAFNPPAPIATANAALSTFDGTDPNGTWRLFVQDDNAPTGVGYFTGWELEIKAKAKVKKGRR
jgi:subtilisin-like proprotein convertase family protein